MTSTLNLQRANYGLSLLIYLLSTAVHLAAGQTSDGGNLDQLQYQRFNPSMAVIIVVLVVALFFMAFFSIYIRQCSDGAGTGAVRPVGGIGVGRSRRAARGIDSAVIETFPTMLYSEVKGLKVGKGALECAVCLNEFEDDETLRLIPKCDHVFHPECIDAWLVSHTTCPVCRAILAPDSVESGNELGESNNIGDEDRHELDVELGDHNRINEMQDGELEVMSLNQNLNRSRTRGSRSGRPRKFPRSHSTGHSLIQPGEDTERFTLRLPVEIRKQMMNRQLNRAMSMVVLSGEGSRRSGFRTGGEGSSRGKSTRRLDRLTKSDRWWFTMTPPFLVRASSIRSSRTPSIRSPRPVAKQEGTSIQL